MGFLKASLLSLTALVIFSGQASATVILEVLEPPATPGNAYTGTFLITPSVETWAFGVGNDLIQDTSISGVTSIDGLDANAHWTSALIARSRWESGFDFDSIRPIGATAPSSFSIDTTSVGWQWGSTEYVAFYWLSEAGDDASNPLAVLQADTQYDAFNFFTSGPNSPFAAFGTADGGNIITGETIVQGDVAIPEPASMALFALGSVGMLFHSRRRKQKPGRFTPNADRAV